MWLCSYIGVATGVHKSLGVLEFLCQVFSQLAQVRAVTAFKSIAGHHRLALRGLCPCGLSPRFPLPDGLGLLGSAFWCPSHLCSSFSTSAQSNVPPYLACGLQIDTINAPDCENLKFDWAWASFVVSWIAITKRERAITVKTNFVYKSDFMGVLLG